MTERHPLEMNMNLGHWEFFKMSCADGHFTDLPNALDDRTRPVQATYGIGMLNSQAIPFITINDLVDMNAPLPKEDRVGGYWKDLNGKEHTTDPFTGVIK